MSTLKILILFVLISSCSSIQFKSQSIIPVSFEENKNHFKEVDTNIQKSFYLWGLIPSTQDVNLDKLFQEEGYIAVSNLKIKEIETKKKAIWMLVSLGLYYPQTFQLTAKATQ